MPIMPRIPGKPKKIAYGLLGVPSNMKDSERKKDSLLRKKLNYEYTQRVK